MDVIELIRAICLLISAALIIITAIGILRLDDDMDGVIYVRINLLGVMDMAGVLALIALDQILLGAIYFVLTPILAYTLANAYYYGEDDKKFKTSSDENQDSKEDFKGSREEAKMLGIESKEVRLIHESNNKTTLDEFQDDQIRSLKDEKYIISTLKLGEDEDD